MTKHLTKLGHPHSNICMYTWENYVLQNDQMIFTIKERNDKKGTELKFHTTITSKNKTEHDILPAQLTKTCSTSPNSFKWKTCQLQNRTKIIYVPHITYITLFIKLVPCIQIFYYVYLKIYMHTTYIHPNISCTITTIQFQQFIDFNKKTFS